MTTQILAILGILIFYGMGFWIILKKIGPLVLPTLTGDLWALIVWILAFVLCIGIGSLILKYLTTN